MLTDDGLVLERPLLDGVQRFYRFGDYGLSLINYTTAHIYPYAWEVALIKYEGDSFRLIYDAALTDDVEVFMNDEETNEFIEKARHRFNGL